jgi:hypothetical protein
MTDNITTAVGGRTRRTVDVSTAETAARAILAMFEELQERQEPIRKKNFILRRTTTARRRSIIVSFA